jgi:hypothetical protein
MVAVTPRRSNSEFQLSKFKGNGSYENSFSILIASKGFEVNNLHLSILSAYLLYTLFSLVNITPVFRQQSLLAPALNTVTARRDFFAYEISRMMRKQKTEV